jgi:uncharacterized damage-inducible protein DinB
MLTMFRYNWQVRDEWFEWCKQVPPDELVRERTGGVRSILHTFYHITDNEVDWILSLKGKTSLPYDFTVFDTLDKVINLSRTHRPEIEEFVLSLTPETENKMFGVQNGKTNRFFYWEVVRHVIAHEIHHIGQLAVWARELGLDPVSANLIGRGLLESSEQ